MKILAIDPGPSESAYVEFWVEQQSVVGKGFIENEAMRSLIHTGIGHDIMVVEDMQCFGMPAGKDMFQTMFWAGRFVEANFASHCDRFELLPRSRVKMHLCQSMRAKDANIRQALIDRFGKPGTKKAPGRLFGIANHLWSALAIAVTAADKLRKEP